MKNNTVFNSNIAADDYAAYLFHQGTNYNAYKFMGSHYTSDRTGITFRVWAPNADNVTVTGDFNGWSIPGFPMARSTDGGVWTAEIDSGLFTGGRDKYKYCVERFGNRHLKADPYAFYSETLKHTASYVYDYSGTGFEWHDRGWLEYRRKTMSAHEYCCPMNIYEIHLGSWKTRGGKTTRDNANAYLSYDEIADELIPYVKRMGYTHIELMPVMEHPFDGSWGYQVCGYYAPTSRFGKPAEFMSFVDRMHSAGIGVILDWVPAHFPKDEHGLYEFDGAPLYEYQGYDRMEHEGWGTRCFDVGRNEVQSFLVSNALFWLEVYHADGLRVDAVASMLYLDYDRRPGEWIPNVNGGRENLESIAFFQKLNTAVRERFPDALMIAEESTAWAKITGKPEDDGLGFSFKWNMGWANDMFSYIQKDPVFRKHHHGELTFSMMYAFDENFILPVSHDEVVHGKLSLINKMFGSYEAKFAGMRVFMAHMMAHPGKKLMFMGCEYGQFREWDYENQLEWFMLDFDSHRKMQYYTASLNRFYLETPELWEDDFSWDGFGWIEADSAEANVIVYKRTGKDGNSVICLLNFANAARSEYEIEVSDDGEYEVLFDTENIEYGGRGSVNPENPSAENGILKINLAPLSGVFIKFKMGEGKLYV